MGNTISDAVTTILPQPSAEEVVSELSRKVILPCCPLREESSFSVQLEDLSNFVKLFVTKGSVAKGKVTHRGRINSLGKVFLEISKDAECYSVTFAVENRKGHDSWNFRVTELAVDCDIHYVYGEGSKAETWTDITPEIQHLVRVVVEKSGL